MTDPTGLQADAALNLDAEFSPEPDKVESVSPLIRRIVAANPGPFTFRGTCTYVVGHGSVAVIDPGPANPEHVAAIRGALAPGERITHIVVTHTHNDHSPGARLLASATGALIVGCGPHRTSRPLGEGESNAMEGAGDREHRPDREMLEGDTVMGPGWTLQALATPGHTANHLAFLLPEEGALFSGDHVMAWSTTIVAPPDGSMSDYMASLEKLRAREEDAVYWPGHGGPVREPRRFVRALIAHRRQREAAILSRLAEAPASAADIVSAIYRDLAPALVRAARLSVFAHLEDLVGRRLALTDGEPTLDATYRAASA